MTQSLMIQGTASSSGKSLMVAALCRIFHQDGLRVAPFKAQNMSNNSFVTADGLEMGRAQVVQALAAGLEPDVRMNPVLLKPSTDVGAQVVLNGRAAFVMDARQWHATRERLKATIREAYHSLAAGYDLMVIEGAGSPAEINLRHTDVVNMGMARMARAPVIIVGDIDRGGVFAALVGTLQLLDADERRHVKGFIINKFRGDVGLLQPGLDELEKITGVPVLGVVPWIDHAIDDEDGVAQRLYNRACRDDCAEIDICIIRLPHISNFTDFIPLERCAGVSVRWCDRADAIGSPDLLIVPGTKATIADLRLLKASGIAGRIVDYAHSGGSVLGICGGFQMLGDTISDPLQVESAIAVEEGLDLLDMETVFEAHKQTEQVTARVFGCASGFFTGLGEIAIAGYEIHMGKSYFGSTCRVLTRREGDTSAEAVMGVADLSGRVAGTYLHGLFDDRRVVRAVVNNLRSAQGLAPLDTALPDRREALERDLDRLADVCRQALDMETIRAIASRPVDVETGCADVRSSITSAPGSICDASQ